VSRYVISSSAVDQAPAARPYVLERFDWRSKGRTTTIGDDTSGSSPDIGHIGPAAEP